MVEALPRVGDVAIGRPRIKGATRSRRPSISLRPSARYRTLRVHATAYALRGRTSRGTYTCPGTVAVDPRVIPYGTRMFIPGYGWGTALDCGGAIRGNIIDLWMPSNAQCYRWGNRTVTIRVEMPRRPALLASRKGSRKAHGHR